MSSAESVSIIGLGASGNAAAQLALAKGETVYVSDISTDARIAADVGSLEALGARVQLGAHDLSRIQAARLVVVSPGIPPDSDVLRELGARGVRWVSEPEFAVRFYQGPLIAVTGTNGKTTTAALIAHLLNASGIDAALGGNVGGGVAPPASELALREPPPSWYVLEMSSFQLADTEEFAPEIGVLTNLAPDHLDRYPDLAGYYADKARLFRNGTSDSRWVLNGEDSEALALPGNALGRRYTFTLLERSDDEARDPVDAGPYRDSSAFLRDGVLTLRISSHEREPGSEEPLLDVSELTLLGRHNVMNALAGSLTARLAGAEVVGIRDGLRSFRPLPHRLEPVADEGGILWVNDSKATNVAAARSAMESLDRPLVVLLGGTDKGEDLRPLGHALRGRVRAAILYGEASERLEKELREAMDSRRDGGQDRTELQVMEGLPHLTRIPDGFDAAVGAARALAREGDIILLSPACSSFDLFDGYESRGRRFRELARRGGP